MNMDLTNGGNYAILPAKIRYDKNLTDSEKLLFCELTALSNNKGFCYASNKYLSGIFNVTTGTVSKRINRLKEKGYLKIIMIREGLEIKERHIYPLLDNPLSSAENDESDPGGMVANDHRGIVANDHRGMVANDQVNILSINKLNNNSVYKEIPKEQREKEIKEFVEYYESNFGMITHNVLIYFEELREYGMAKDLIVEAYNIALSKNNKNQNYIRGIINKWKAEKIMSVDQIPEKNEGNRKRLTGTTDINSFLKDL